MVRNIVIWQTVFISRPLGQFPNTHRHTPGQRPPGATPNPFGHDKSPTNIERPHGGHAGSQAIATLLAKHLLTWPVIIALVPYIRTLRRRRVYDNTIDSARGPCRRKMPRRESSAQESQRRRQEEKKEERSCGPWPAHPATAPPQGLLAEAPCPNPSQAPSNAPLWRIAPAWDRMACRTVLAPPSAADDPPQAGPGTSDERPTVHQSETGRPIEQTNEGGATPRGRFGRRLPRLNLRVLGGSEWLGDAERGGLRPYLKAARGEDFHATHARGVRPVTFSPEIAHTDVRATVRPHESTCITR